MSNFKIAWMLPDTLYLHGERGTVLALEKYARLMDLKPQTDKIDLLEGDFNSKDYQIIFFPPGSIKSFPAVLDWLKDYRDSLKEYVQDGGTMLVTGTSIGLFGKEGLDILDISYREKEMPYGDDLYFRCQYNGKEMEVIGNQIQMIDVDKGSEELFGEIIYGYGNTGRDKGEGVIRNNSIFTNALGPLLVNNPWLTVEIIEAAAGHSGIAIKEYEYDMALERESFEVKKAYILDKETELTNL